MQQAETNRAACSCADWQSGAVPHAWVQKAETNRAPCGPTSRSWINWLAFAGLLFLVAAQSPGPAAGEEPADAFLAELCNRRHYDLALDYLTQMESSPLAPASFRRRIPLLRAETIIKSIEDLRNETVWEARMAEAQRLLEDFAANASTPEDRCFAAETLASLRFKQARFYLNKMEKPTHSDTERETSRARARELLQQSINAFTTARKITNDRLEELLKPGNDAATIDRATLDRLKDSFTQILLRMPIAGEFLADTWPAGSAEQKQLLEQAEKDYLVVWEKYFRYAAGVDACMFAARCRQKLGRDAEALQLLDELLTMDDKPELLPIKLKAALLAIESWRKTNPYPYEPVIQRLQPVLANLSRQQQRDPDWLAVQLEVAIALKAKADALVASGGANSEARDLNQSAASLAKTVARVPGAIQPRALELLATWNIEINAADEAGALTELPPESFDDARARALDLIGEIDSLRIEGLALKEKLKSAAEADRAGVEAALVTNGADLKAAVTKALAMLRIANGMVNEDTPRADRNHVRYLQAFCHLAAGRYLHAALIGEFLVDRYPGEEWTRQAAVFVVNSNAAMYEAAPADNRVFEQQRLAGICGKIIKLWPGSPEAGQAAEVLARLAVASNDMDAAQALVGTMAEGSGGRAAISLQLAQRIWNEVAQARVAAGAGATAEQQAAWAAKIEEARVLLASALESARPENADFSLARGSVLLARILNEKGDPLGAVDQLERPGLGALDLIKQQHPAVTGNDAAVILQRETLRTAITAYLGCMKAGGDVAQWIAKAEGVLEALRQQLAALPAEESRRELTGIYSAIATELKAQIRAIGEPAEQLNLANNLGVFLKSLAETASDGRTILWAASTMIDVADSLVSARPASGTQTSAGSLPPQSVASLFGTAVTLLEKARVTGFAGDAQEEALRLESGRYLGLAQRGAGNWDDAMKAFVEVLGARPSLLPAQLDAAETLQMQGVATKSATAVGLAMMGTEPRADPKTKRKSNVIWGWRQLVMVTRGKPEFAAVHARSLYGLIASRLEYGLLEPSPDAVKSAQTELVNFRTRDPELGGPEWKARFEALELRISQNIKQ